MKIEKIKKNLAEVSHELKEAEKKSIKAQKQTDKLIGKKSELEMKLKEEESEK